MSVIGVNPLRRPATIGAALVALGFAAAACTSHGSTTTTTTTATSPTKAAASSVRISASAAPSNARQVQAQLCPAVPTTAVASFFVAVSQGTATSCHPVSNTTAAWTTKTSKRQDLLTVSIFDRSFGKSCGLNNYGNGIESLSLDAHSAAVVDRGSAGGLFLCWSSAAQRVVLMAVNTPPSVDYASIKGPAVALAKQLIGKL